MGDQLRGQQVERVSGFVLQLNEVTMNETFLGVTIGTHLVLLKLESNQLTESDLIEMEQMQEIDVDLCVLKMILEAFEHEIEHAIRIDIEVADQRHETVVQLFGGEFRDGEVLVQFSDGLGEAFALFAQQIELLLLVTTDGKA